MVINSKVNIFKEKIQSKTLQKEKMEDKNLFKLAKEILEGETVEFATT